MGKEKTRRDEIPERFQSYEDAGKFWDTHDSTDYLNQMTPVTVDAHLVKRHFEVEIDKDLVTLLRQRADSEHLSASKLANNLLRKELLSI